MKKFIVITVGVMLAIVLFVGIVFYSVSKSPFKGESEFTVEVKEGNSFYDVIYSLEGTGNIKSSMLTKLYIKLNNISVNLVPGIFTVKKDASLEEFINILENSNEDKNIINVTIPEGYNIDSMGILFEEKGLFSKEEFINAVKEYDIPSYIPKLDGQRYEMEGFLFPDTYKFVSGITPNEVITMMNKEFEKVVESITKESNKDIEDIYKLVTMASIVEKEAVVEEERSIISSVFYNRLEIDMKFQSCATVLYSLGKHKDKLYEKDLEIQSPYNTYIVTGYPVGPIASPGKSSLMAALNPKDTNYIYFVANNDGTHFFTDNYNEFLKVKEKTQGF